MSKWSHKCDQIDQKRRIKARFNQNVWSESLSNFSAAESDGDPTDWAMEQEEAIESLLCEAPSLLPALALSLAPGEGPPPPEGPAASPAASPPTPVSTSSQSKGVKVGRRSGRRGDSGWRCLLHNSVCLQVKEENVIPQIKLEPHEVDQFLNLSHKGLICLIFTAVFFKSKEDLCWSLSETTTSYPLLNQIQSNLHRLF